MKRFIVGTLLVLAVGGAGVARSLAEASRNDAPRYYWYDVAQTDSFRVMLNASAPGTVRLKMEERTKRHVWGSVVPVDSTISGPAMRVLAPFEVQESTWCPPLCLADPTK